MTQMEALRFWRQSARENRKAAIDTMEKHPEWGFFLWHLAIEKLLKGLLIKLGTVPPPTHDLEKLAHLANIKPTKEQEESLAEITTYNIAARYDDYKRQYYTKVVQRTYVSNWSKRCEELYLWLDRQY